MAAAPATALGRLTPEPPCRHPARFVNPVPSERSDDAAATSNSQTGPRGAGLLAPENGRSAYRGVERSRCSDDKASHEAADCCGVETMSFLSNILKLVSPEVRRAYRHTANSFGRVNRPRWDERAVVTHAMIVRNVSTSGCLIETEVPLEVGDMIELSFGDVVLHPAIVRRDDKSRYGCAFAVPLGKRHFFKATAVGQLTMAQGNLWRGLST